ncbi:MAG: HEAT repeat domain-containing protein [Planctomycetota bacterium]
MRRFGFVVCFALTVCAGCASEPAPPPAQPEPTSPVERCLRSTRVEAGKLAEERKTIEELDRLAQEGQDVERELVAILADGRRAELRAVAALLLGQRYAGSRTSLKERSEALLSVMRDPSATVRRDAAFAFRWAQRADPNRAGTSQEVSTERPANQVAALRALLSDPDGDVRLEAATTIGEWGGLDVVPQLLEDLRAPAVERRRAAVIGLGCVVSANPGSTRPGIGALRDGLVRAKANDPDSDVRVMATDVLKQLGAAPPPR